MTLFKMNGIEEKNLGGYGNILNDWAAHQIFIDGNHLLTLYDTLKVNYN